MWRRRTGGIRVQAIAGAIAIVAAKATRKEERAASSNSHGSVTDLSSDFRRYGASSMALNTLVKLFLAVKHLSPAMCAGGPLWARRVIRELSKVPESDPLQP
jgi:hypothetical protein